MAIKRYIGIAKETEYGIHVTTNASYIWTETTESLKSDLNYNIIDPIATRQRMKALKGNWRIRGNIGPVNIELENIVSQLLYGALGSDNPSNLGGTPAAWKHTITPADTLPSFSIRSGLDTKERRLSGCIVDGFTLEARYNEIAKFTARMFSGKYETVEDTLTTDNVSFSSLNPLTYADVTVKIDNDSETTRLFDVSIDFNNGLIDKGSLGSRTYDTVRVGPRTINGKFSTYFDNIDDWTRMMNGTPFKLEIILTGTLISGSNYYQITITLPKCIIKSDALPHVMPINEPLIIDVPFEALYDDTAEYDIQIEIINTRSTAY